MSHRNSGSLTCGTLTPLLVEEVIAGTRCHLRIPEVVQLPPLASDTYMNVKLKHEAFFVPFRIMCQSFEDWFAEFPRMISGLQDTSSTNAPQRGQARAALPVFRIMNDAGNLFGPMTLLDYLGLKASSVSTFVDISPFSLIAYHLIWQEWYRNPRVQQPAFVPSLGAKSYANASNTSYRVMNMLDQYFYYGGNLGSSNLIANNLFIFSATSSVRNTLSTLADGSNIFSLRQRNFGLDYFTGARVSPQQGNPASVSMNVPIPTSGDATASFTIAQLRASNSLQQFRERNNLPSPRMVDQVYARYGVRMSDGVAQRPILIGSSSYDVVTRGVDQTANGVSPTASQTPFNSVANQYGRAMAFGDGVLIDDFEAKEPGIIMVLQSLVPEVTYGTGTRAYLTRYVEEGSLVEMATPLLQNVGDEPIVMRQLVDDASQDGIFAYQDRYGTFCFHPNEVHGKLKDGQDLSSFVLQRSFATNPQYGSQFLEIPTNYLDGVFAVSNEVSGLSAWYDAKLDWRITLPLAEFSIPSLQDPAYEHGESISLTRNGQVF